MKPALFLSAKHRNTVIEPALKLSINNYRQNYRILLKLGPFHIVK